MRAKTLHVVALDAPCVAPLPQALNANENIVNYTEFYNELFKPLESKYGKLDKETMSSIVGFTMGGPVSLSKKDKSNLFVTCELAAHPEQKLSTDGFRFELFSMGHFSATWCRSVFTALGQMSLNTQLGNEHTIDISGVVEPDCPVKSVKLELFSFTEFDGKRYGLYQVSPTEGLTSSSNGLSKVSRLLFQKPRQFCQPLC